MKNPFKKKSKETYGIVGFQYVFQDYISLIADFGGDYKKDIAQTLLYRGAIQFKLLSDFYARLGYFRNRQKEENGTGVGVGWVQPKLVIETALKNTSITKASKMGKLTETSISLAYRF